MYLYRLKFDNGVELDIGAAGSREKAIDIAESMSAIAVYSCDNRSGVPLSVAKADDNWVWEYISKPALPLIYSGADFETSDCVMIALYEYARQLNGGRFLSGIDSDDDVTHFLGAQTTDSVCFVWEYIDFHADALNSKWNGEPMLDVFHSTLKKNESYSYQYFGYDNHDKNSLGETVANPEFTRKVAFESGQGQYGDNLWFIQEKLNPEIEGTREVDGPHKGKIISVCNSDGVWTDIDFPLRYVKVER